MLPDLAQYQLLHGRLRLPLAVDEPGRLRQIPVEGFLILLLSNTIALSSNLLRWTQSRSGGT